MIEQRCGHVQMIALVVLRVLIGWHFLYEGVAKMQKETWSAAGFLLQSRGLFAGVFRWIADSPNALEVVNWMNVWGLTAVGLGLILGGFTRAAAVSGALLILLYYLCNPPFIGFYYSIPVEGSYLIVNKNLVEMAALLVIAVTGSGRYAGVDRILHAFFSKKKSGSQGSQPKQAGAPA